MALNWTMVSPDGARPVPLPHEKFLCSVEHCTLALELKEHKLKWDARGNAFVSNQRIVFLRQPPLPAPADPSEPSPHLRSLSVPLTHFQDTRYIIPIFSAPYYEARVMPVADGGLAPRTSAATTTTTTTRGATCKIWFGEGGGQQFAESVDEVRRRALEEGGGGSGVAAGEALPLYEPPAPGSEAARSLAQDASTATAPAAVAGVSTLGHAELGAPSSAQLTAEPASAPVDASEVHGAGRGASGTQPPPPGSRARRLDSLPADAELEAARVALESEERERWEELQRSVDASATATAAAAREGGVPGGPAPPDAPRSIATDVTSTSSAARGETREQQQETAANEQGGRGAEGGHGGGGGAPNVSSVGGVPRAAAPLNEEPPAYHE